MPESQKGRRLTCMVCNRSYGRMSHLRRHMKNHSGAKEYVCHDCPKKFTRIDSFRRHQACFPGRLPPGSAVDSHKVTSRACNHCAKSRQRCSHAAPCARCSEKGLECVFPVEANISHGGNPSSTIAALSMSPGGASDTEDLSTSNRASLPEQRSPRRSPVQELDAVGATLELGRKSITIPSCVDASLTASDSAQPHRVGQGDCTTTYSHSAGTQFYREEEGSFHVRMEDGISPTSCPDRRLTSLSTSPGMAQDDWQILSLTGRPELSDTNMQAQAAGSVSLLRKTAPSQTSFIEPGHYTPNQDFSPATASSASSRQDMSLNSDSRSAKYYSSGGGARDTIFNEVSRSSRFCLSRLPRVDSTAGMQQFGFPEIPEHSILRDTTPWEPVSDATYDRLCGLFQNLCRGNSYLFTEFTSLTFVPRNFLNRCITEYFDKPHITLPFIHKSTYSEAQDDILFLATAAVGASFIYWDQIIELSAAFHEFLRRALLTRAEALRNDVDKLTNLPFIQGSLLSVVGLYHHGNNSMQSEAVKTMRSLINFCREHRLFLSENDRSSITVRPMDWRAWMRLEELRRTIYCIWLLSEMLDPEQQQSFCLDIVSIQLSLPCSEEIFNASSAENWSQLMEGTKLNPTLFECLRTLELDHHLHEGLSQLGHILLVHALFARNRQMKEHIYHITRFGDDGLATIWNISSDSHVAFHDLLSFPPWIEWRNQMCDSLDILHRHANGMTGHAGGFEEPIVLHLHLARIILLSPYNDIQQMAEFLSCRDLSLSKQYPERSMTERQYAQMLTTIRVWLSDDQYKMRLAVIHAGGIFWHIRRYSVQGFYEPAALFSAALIIWSYCLRTKFLSRLSTDPRLHPEGFIVTPHIKPSDNIDEQTSGDSSDTMRIYIDRVLDDELVQTLVLGQDPVEVCMRRIGNLDMAQAPRRVLNEAARLLQLRCSTWPISTLYYERLTRLAEPSRQMQ